MAWIRFTDNYNYRKPAFTIAYKTGMTQNVTSECATLAIAAGKAVRLRKPNKDAEPTEWQSSEAPQPDNSASASTFKSGPSPQTSSATKSAVGS